MAGETVAIIKVGERFDMANAVKGHTKDKGYPYILVIKQAEKGYKKIKMFVHNAQECWNAQSVTVKEILDCSVFGRKAPSGAFYDEVKITADCTPEDVYADERQKAGDDFEKAIGKEDKVEGGLFDQYIDGNELPFV